MQIVPTATPVEISDEARTVLEGWSRSFKVAHRLRQRALIVLLCGEGLASRAVARKVGCTPGTASRWRVRYAREGLDGLEDRRRPGKAPSYTVATDRRILAQLDKAPAKGYARWSAPLLAEALGDVSDQYIWRFLRAQKIDLAGRKSWCTSTDPEFAVKAAAIVGLYLAPPENAIVLAVDEKPSIQALERAQGYLKLFGGKTPDRPVPHLQTARHDDLVRGPECGDGENPREACETAAAQGVSGLYERCRGHLSGSGNPCHP